MHTSDSKQWLRTAVLVGTVYFVIGIAFSAFARMPGSNPKTWNLLSFVISAVVFAIHLRYEHFRLHNSPRITALHVSMAVALGAFALAVSANVHGIIVGSNRQGLLAFALVAWPAMTAVPAFLLALAAAAGLALKRRKT